MDAYQLLTTYRRQIAVSAAILVVLTGCIVSAQAQDFELSDGQPNTEQRLKACAASFDNQSKDFADCLAGRISTHNESCLAGFQFLGNQWVSSYEKQAVLELMRKRNCL